jgi:hypothetical protein
MSVDQERRLGRSLRADRDQGNLRTRRQRLEIVMAVLRERAAKRQRSVEAVPPPLRAATADYPSELGAARRSERHAPPKSGRVA